MVEIIIAALAIVLSIIWCFIWSRIQKDNIEIILFFIISCIVILFVYPAYMLKSFIGTTIVINFFQIIVSIFIIRSIGYVKLRHIDYAMIIFPMFLIQQYFLTRYFFASIMSCVTWVLLCIVTRRRYNILKKIAFQMLISYICSFIVFVLYSLIINQGILELYYTICSLMDFGNINKIMLLGMFAVIFLVIMVFIVLAIKKILQNYIERIKNFSEKYEEIGHYFLAIPFFISALLFILDIFKFYYKNEIGFGYIVIIGLIFIFFICMQIFYLRLMISTINLKKHLEFKQLEKENIMLYNKDFQKNLQEIREMKHDIKNIFLTMGGYISRSDDTELKNYYKEKIAPYASNQIKMNDIYIKLQNLNNESLKSFFYYKIMQCRNKKIDVNLETSADHTVIANIIDCSDLTRMIGIFVDNAIEETCKIENGLISIIIKEKNYQLNVIIKNSVRESVKKNGIYIGTTSKGLGRGNGLKIVQKLVKKHDDIVWNSYFQNDEYIQSILILNNGADEKKMA